MSANNNITTAYLGYAVAKANCLMKTVELFTPPDDESRCHPMYIYIHGVDNLTVLRNMVDEALKEPKS